MVVVLLAAVVAAAGPAVYIVTLDDFGNSYYLNSAGDGTLEPQTPIGHLDTSSNYGAGIGKFTNDGYYDFVVGSGYTGSPSKEIYFYQKNGPGNSFLQPVSVGTWSSGDYPADMPVAGFFGKVFDPDGLDDFVMVGYGSQNVGVYKNLGNGAFEKFASEVGYAAPLSSFGADAADINHDGDADFVVAQNSGDPPYSITVNLGNGDGTFTPQSFTTAYGTPYYGITAADFDGDYKVDLIATISSGANGFDFYKGDGLGGFVFKERYHENHISANSPVDNYDLDGDGDQDLVASNLIDKAYGVIVGINDGNGQFAFSDPYSGSGPGSGLWTIAAPPVFQNKPPVVVVTVTDGDIIVNPDVQRFRTGTSLEFSNISSYDPEEKPMAFSWWFEDIDSTVTTDGENVTHQFNTPGLWKVKLKLTDNYGATNTTTVSINVNHPPVANGDWYTTDGKNPLTISAAQGVLANDTDADAGDTLTAVMVSGPASGGTLVLNPDGSFTYTPKAGFTGPVDTFTYKANDGLEDSNVATVTLNFNAPETWKVNIVPDTINLRSRGVFIAFITLPKKYNVNDVMDGSVACQGVSAIRLTPMRPIRMFRYSKVFPQTFGAIFRTADFQNVKVGNNVQFTVTGTVKSSDGQLLEFSGSDSVRVFTTKARIKDETEEWDHQGDRNLFDKFPNTHGNGQDNRDSDRDSSGHEGRDQESNGH
jgi:hypothetical protein